MSSFCIAKPFLISSTKNISVKCLTALFTFFQQKNLKKDIRGCHFWSDKVMTAVEEWVNGKDPDFFSSGLMALEHRWSKCITLEGNYIDKEEVNLNQK